MSRDNHRSEEIPRRETSRAELDAGASWFWESGDFTTGRHELKRKLDGECRLRAGLPGDQDGWAGEKRLGASTDWIRAAGVIQAILRIGADILAVSRAIIVQEDGGHAALEFSGQLNRDESDLDHGHDGFF